MDFDFYEVEAPGDGAGVEGVEPVVGTAGDEGAFFEVDGGEAAEFGAFFTGFYFDEEELAVEAGDDVDFAAVGAFVVGGEDFRALGEEVVGGDFFTVVSGGFTGAAGASFLVEG